MISACSVSVNPRGLLSLLLSLLIHDGLYGWAGSFCTEQNHTAKPKFMLSIYHFDDSGPDRTVFNMDDNKKYFLNTKSEY